MTALAFAARRGQLAAVQALLDGGANVNDGAVVYANGVGPSSVLCLAVENGHYGVATYLLERGRRPERRSSGVRRRCISWRALGPSTASRG